MKDRGKIYHLFYGDILFHVMKMVRNINGGSAVKNHYVIWLTDRGLLDRYRSFFQENRIEDHDLLYIGRVPFHTLNGDKKTVWQRICLLWEGFVLWCKLLPYRRCALLVHGFFPTVLRLLSMVPFTNLSFISWGGAMGSGSRSRRLRLMTYAGVRKMIFIQESDLVRYRDATHKDNGVYLGYLGSHLNRDDLSAPVSDTRMILLGNSGDRWQEYIAVLESLKKRAIPKNMEVCCMVAYGIDFDSPEYRQLRDAASSMPFKVVFWEKLVPIDEYVAKLKSAEIIIVGVAIQTALGAINTGIRLGKKMFLAGTNLATMKRLGIHCCDFSELDSLSDEEFFRPLSPAEQEENFSIMENLMASKELAKKWDALYESLLR